MFTFANGSERLYYTVSEVAEMFGISHKSVYRLLERGLLQASSALRHKRITRSSIETFVGATVNNGGAR